MQNVYTFGEFKLDPVRRLLLRSNEPLKLGARALDILIALVQRAEQTVSREQLGQIVWPNMAVDDRVLRVHIAALRKLFGEGRANPGYILTLPGQGYRFDYLVHRQPGQASTAQSDGCMDKLPTTIVALIGRDDLLRVVSKKLQQRRFVTLVGTPGIGKTATAVAIADSLSHAYRDGTVFVNLAVLTDPSHVATALSSALKIPIQSRQAIGDIVSHLNSKQLLVILDNCEHVISAAAELAERLFIEVAGVHILATSREPLRAQGESVHRVQPLEVPPSNDDLGLREALAFTALKLFAERLTGSSDGYELSDASIPAVIDICRKLDGIPLALELAAASVEHYGLQGLAARLGERLALLKRGRRTALPRQKTLRAAMDWSFELLSSQEQALFRRLGTFSGTMNATAIHEIAGADNASPADTFILISNLVSKSLVTADLTSEDDQYHLLETSRIYAREKLVDSGEMDQVARRHAKYFCRLLQRGSKEAEELPPAVWLRKYSGQLTNVRAALSWAFSSVDSIDLALDLTIFAVPLWNRLLLLQESRTAIERALDIPQYDNDYRAMRLYAALGYVAGHADLTAPEHRNPWQKVVDLAEALHDLDYQTRALWGLWVQSQIDGHFLIALEHARKLSVVAKDMQDPDIALIGERMVGYTLHLLGDQTEARKHIEHMLAGYSGRRRKIHIYRYQFDVSVGAKITLSWILWLQGFPDQALRCVEAMIEEAKTLDHPLTLGNALAKSGCAIPLLTGDLDLAGSYIDLFVTNTQPTKLLIWRSLSQAFEGLLAIKSGEVDSGLDVLRTARRGFSGSRFAFPHTWALGELALAEAALGQLGCAHKTIDSALDYAKQDQELWCFPELLRIKGDLILMNGEGAAAEAERYYEQSLDWTRKQCVLSWELRAATSLARLRLNQGRPKQAREMLTPIIERFTEGFGTQDLVAAKSLLASFGT